jgi:exopolyphosphatase/guanosine-5'-triphosphate,3'-diphosphate pyrophosphatase
VFAALDLGTNNCRLLIVDPFKRDYRVVETYTRSVRLGEGLGEDGFLSELAMQRAIEALKECATKLSLHKIKKQKLVATEACRVASNANEFIKRVKKETGLSLRIITQHEEAKLAAYSCISLLERGYDRTLIFDIGGGSTEMVWLNLKSGLYRKGGFWEPIIVNWLSIPKGVVTLSSRFSINEIDMDVYEKIKQETYEDLYKFYTKVKLTDKRSWKNFYLLGTSGTVTTLAALSLGLKKYNRFVVDGLWLHTNEMFELIEKVKNDPATRMQAHSYVGMERADLLIPGCAILEGILSFFPQIRLRVADRGTREGLIYSMMMEKEKKYK